MRWISVVLTMIFLVFAGAVRARACSVRVVPVSFGDYDTSFASALDADGDIYVTCDPKIVYKVWLDPGVNSGGGFIPRKMLLSGGKYTLSYNLYRDSARTEVWGDGTNNTYVRTGAGTGAEVRLTVYGRLPGSQNVGVGSYGDTVTVTVEW